jgi:hypothetical protein
VRKDLELRQRKAETAMALMDNIASILPGSDMCKSSSSILSKSHFCEFSHQNYFKLLDNVDISIFSNISLSVTVLASEKYVVDNQFSVYLATRQN